MRDLYIQAQRDFQVIKSLWDKLPDEWAMQAIMYHLQQAIEKLLKFLCMNYVGKFPYTHNVRELMMMLKGKLELPADLELLADSLTLWESQVRYNSKTLTSLELLTKCRSLYIELSSLVTTSLYEAEPPEPTTEFFQTDPIDKS